MKAQILQEIAEFGLDIDNMDIDESTIAEIYDAILQYKKNKDTQIPHEIMW